MAHKSTGTTMGHVEISPHAAASPVEQITARSYVYRGQMRWWPITANET